MRRIGGVAGVLVVLAVLAGCDLPTYPDGTRALAPQAGPAGTGVSATTIAADARERWRYVADDAPYGGVGTALIQGDLVIVPVAYIVNRGSETDANASRVVALDRLTGEQVWETRIGHDDLVSLSGTTTTVFAQGRQSGLTALDLATGAVRWSTPEHAGSHYPPVAGGGRVFVQEHGFGSAELTARDTATGAVLWTRVVEDIAGGTARLVLSGDVLYLPGVCGSAEAARVTDGKVLWHQEGGCHGGGDATGVVRNGRLYVGGGGGGNTDDIVLLDLATGAVRGGFDARYIPAVGTGNMLVAGRGGGLENRTVDGAKVRWRNDFGDQGVTREPLAVSSTVFTVLDGPYQADRDGEAAELVGVSLVDGTVTHRIPLGAFDAEISMSQDGLAAAEHVIAVPLANELVVVG